MCLFCGSWVFVFSPLFKTTRLRDGFNGITELVRVCDVVVLNILQIPELYYRHFITRHSCTASWIVNVSYRIPAMIVSITLSSNSILSHVPHFFCFQFYSGLKIVHRLFSYLPDLLEVTPREPVVGMWFKMFLELSRDHEFYICNPLAPRARSRLSSCLSILMFLTLKYNCICCWNNANVSSKSRAFQSIHNVIMWSDILYVWVRSCHHVIMCTSTRDPKYV